jgi:hypothetical protein
MREVWRENSFFLQCLVVEHELRLYRTAKKIGAAASRNRHLVRLPVETVISRSFSGSHRGAFGTGVA